MTMWIAAATLVAIGAAHSVLGEAVALRPLLADRSWSLPVLPRAEADGLLRFAWHLTTLAWWALAAVLVGAPITLVFAATCLGSALFIFGLFPGHVAWPPFLAAGMLALWSAGAVPAWLLWISVGAGVAIALVAAAFHVAWATGSKWGIQNAVPQRPGSGKPAFLPGPAPTLAVAALLTAYAALAVAQVMNTSAAWVTWLLIAGLALLTLRVMGDGRWMGVTKRVRDTGFAHADNRWWTPAAATLALGAASAVSLG